MSILSKNLSRENVNDNGLGNVTMSLWIKYHRRKKIKRKILVQQNTLIKPKTGKT
jgi:hypothetical protein